MHRALYVFLIGCFLIPATTARAQYFEFSSTASISNVTSPIPNSVVTTAPGPNGANSSTVTDLTVGDSLNYTGRNHANRADGANHLSAVPPGTDISIVTMGLTNLSDTDSTTFDFDYSVTLNLTDYNARTANATTNPPVGSGSIVVAGHLTGTYDVNQQNTTTFTMVPQNGGTFVAGGVTYQLSSFSFAPPSDIDIGAITAHLTSVVPEPASLTLLVGMMTVCRRRRPSPQSRRAA